VPIADAVAKVRTAIDDRRQVTTRDDLFA
jgi:hypothetical protein